MERNRASLIALERERDKVRYTKEVGRKRKLETLKAQKEFAQKMASLKNMIDKRS